MALELHLHPLSSYCWKVLIALYEAGTPFKSVTVNLGDEAARAAYLQLSPFGKIPALRDTDRGVEVFETSIIIEYLDRRHPGAARLIPEDLDQALEVRLWDRIFDSYVMNAFQPIVANRLRPPEQRDAVAVEGAHANLRKAYAVIDRRLAGRTWAAGETFSMADCAAAPSLFYAAIAEPLDGFPVTAAYRQRLLERPSVARAVREANPFFRMFPATEEERARMPVHP
ncbi:MAG TPA: glutathione S-transferase family protein [Phenylobacterium sp.]|uniref:glutathione S-transferase family protein n=1 Tax=Phenylobacterium sp. TaxID=1871053 RepID=UPI002B4601D7|nr:glutathione S-transferase family protein [Phenylobacterium sp.]HKR89716.1 glutathione S-transferase family protein [Phenylobacterium sp.]HKT52805.1 glutathione S-transferase family protein [Caulobacteraceae bacterium]